MIKNNYETISKLDGYKRDSCSRMSNNTLRIEGPQPLTVINPKLLEISDF